MAAQDENPQSGPQEDPRHQRVIDDLNAEIERKTKEVHIIRQISSEINSTLDLDKILDIILDSMDAVLGFKHCMILLADPSGERLTLAASRGYENTGIGAEVKVGEGVIGVVAKKRRMMRMGNIQTQLAYLSAVRARMEAAGQADRLQDAPSLPGLPDAQSQIAIPLVVKDTLVGVYAVESAQANAFDELDEILLTIVANQVGGAIDNARLHQSEIERAQELEKAKNELRFQQQEKMAALGKVSAGIAHDLNNPAAASLRATQELTEVLHAVAKHAMALARMSLTPDQLERLFGVKQEAAPNPDATAAADPLRQSELEDRISDWLEEHEIEEGWKLGPTFSQAGLSVERLESLAAALPGEARAAAFAWLERSLAADALVRETRQATRRISDLVHAVKSYSFMDQAPRQDVDIHRGLEDTLTILDHKLREREIVVHREFDPDLPHIDAYGAELNQVWTNLIDNAIHAAGTKGIIRLRTARTPGGEGGEAVTVDVADNGPGVPEEIRSKIFEPFFTTKDVGEGTGLGLQIVQRIVCEMHKGEITLDSKPGETRFQVRLPISGD